MNRTCTACGVSKPLDEFHRRSKDREGRHPRCRACRNDEWNGASQDRKVRAVNRLLYWPPPRVRV